MTRKNAFDSAMLYTPVAAGVVFGAFGWFALGLNPAFVLIVSAVHLSFSYRLTQVIRRYIAICTAGGKPVMAGTVAGLGLAICLGDAFIVHTGLDWMLGESGMQVAGGIVWIASLCLSAYNMAADWGFGSDIAEAAPAAPAARTNLPAIARELSAARPDFSVILTRLDAETEGEALCPA